MTNCESGRALRLRDGALAKGADHATAGRASDRGQPTPASGVISDVVFPSMQKPACIQMVDFVLSK
jgi:hypothetical protein